ncbi:uncharacterized protein UHOD_11235 [Ustilago sp. UG-2017b]|nr:uncharacterized protein UHOD_11235 [Ustilago sp. UG-2017b]
MLEREWKCQGLWSGDQMSKKSNAEEQVKSQPSHRRRCKTEQDLRVLTANAMSVGTTCEDIAGIVATSVVKLLSKQRRARG